MTVLDDVVVGPSPQWIARRLLLAGMRPINNVVDASNYVMLELGQPTHPYDLARLPGRGLSVRRAEAGRDGRDTRRRGADGGRARPQPWRHGRGLPHLRRRGKARRHRRHHGRRLLGDRRLDDRGPLGGRVLHTDGDRAHVQAARPADRGVGALRAWMRSVGDRAVGAAVLRAVRRKRSLPSRRRRHARRAGRGARTLRGVGADRPRAAPDRGRSRRWTDRTVARADRLQGARGGRCGLRLGLGLGGWRPIGDEPGRRACHGTSADQPA